MSFNILAPCYFRHAGRLESKDPASFIARASHLLDPVLSSEAPDLICLQEYYFHPLFQQFFHDHLDANYRSFVMKRPGQKEDGLAIFVSKSRFDVHQVIPLTFDAGERVSMVMHLSFNDIVEERGVVLPLTGPRSSFLLTNCHLTFPHNTFNRLLRLQQINTTLTALQNYQALHGLQSLPSLFCGDFNDVHDAVHTTIREAGYQSAFATVNGHEARVTHCNHTLDNVGVDFIFYKPLSQMPRTVQPSASPSLVFTPSKSYLLPPSLPDDTILHRPTFGHNWNEVQGSLEKSRDDLIQYWSLLSDHRPLVTHFDVSEINRI